jgi:hypothetical protein
VLFSGVLALRLPMLSDTAWLLWVAHRFLHGAVVYRDVVQMNPPLSHWLHVPPVVIAEWTGWPLKLVFIMMAMLWSAGCVALAVRICRGWKRLPIERLSAAVILTIVTVAAAGPFFGQREQFILSAALPWLALLAVRQDGLEPGSAPALAAGAVLALGISLKPFYVGWWAAAPLMHWFGPREPDAGTRPFWRWPEFWLVPALGAMYLAVVSGTAYPAFVRSSADLYWLYFHRPWWFVAFGNPFALFSLGGLALTARSAWRTKLGTALWLGTAAAWAGAVAQGKAFPYHYWPAIGLAFLLLCYAGIATRRALAAPVGVTWTAYLLFLMVDGGKAHWRNAEALDRAVGPGTVLTLGTTADDAWMLTSEFGRPWLSPQYDLWWLAISGGAEEVPGVPDWSARDSALRASLLPAEPPDVLLIGESDVDVGAYLTRSPAWLALLSGYRPGEEVSGYRIWRRREPS